MLLRTDYSVQHEQFDKSLIIIENNLYFLNVLVVNNQTNRSHHVESENYLSLMSEPQQYLVYCSLVELFVREALINAQGDGVVSEGHREPV